MFLTKSRKVEIQLVVHLTSEQFQTVRLTLTQIASLAGTQALSEIESLAEKALIELRHAAIDSHHPEAIGLESQDKNDPDLIDL
jgi:hypothetical protein